MRMPLGLGGPSSSMCVPCASITVRAYGVCVTFCGHVLKEKAFLTSYLPSQQGQGTARAGVKLFRPRNGAHWSAHSSVQHPCGKLLPWQDCPQRPMSQDYQHLFSTSPEGRSHTEWEALPEGKSCWVVFPYPFFLFSRPPDPNPTGYTMRKQAFISGFV